MLRMQPVPVQVQLQELIHDNTVKLISTCRHFCDPPAGRAGGRNLPIEIYETKQLVFLEISNENSDRTLLKQKRLPDQEAFFVFI